MGKSGVVCAIAECCNTSSLRNDLSMHRFPTDLSIRKQRIVKCRRKDDCNPSTTRICSEHLASEDFERDLKAELLGLVATRRLKVGTIPSLNLSKQECSKITSDAVKTRKKQVKSINHQVKKQMKDQLPKGKNIVTDLAEKISKKIGKKKFSIAKKVVKKFVKMRIIIRIINHIKEEDSFKKRKRF